MQLSTIQGQESILVVDDTPNNLKLLFQHLDGAGYKVFIAQTGTLALQIAQKVVPDLILLDIMMPEIDGFSLCSQLKNNATTKNIPIIFMTALTETKYKVKGFNFGGVDYIAKPFDPDELLARIANHLTIQKLTKSLKFEARQKQLLFDIADRIRLSLDLKTIFQTATSEIRDFLQCDRLSLIRLSQQDIIVESQSFCPQIIDHNLKQITLQDFAGISPKNPTIIVTEQRLSPHAGGQPRRGARGNVAGEPPVEFTEQQRTWVCALAARRLHVDSAKAHCTPIRVQALVLKDVVPLWYTPSDMVRRAASAKAHCTLVVYRSAYPLGQAPPTCSRDILGEQLTDNHSESEPALESSLMINKTMRSQLFIPILLESIPQANQHHPLWGWLVAEQCSLRHWQEQEQMFLKQLVTQLSIAINQGYLYQQVQNSNQQLQNSNQRFRQLALYDSLTKIYNRRYFQLQLDKEWRRLRRNVSSLSLILCDIDCFKLYNDTYGHQQGDLCLQRVAEALASKIKRPGDVLARYGGEEFVVILPETGEQGAVKVAEAMRVAVKELQIPHRNSLVDSMVTMSLGVATTLPNADENYSMLVEAADKALYQAKNRGRDCIAVYHGATSQSESQQDLEIQWDQRIRIALEKNLFSLYVQPIASLKTDSRQHYEILLRLEDRGKQVFTPGDFFDVAERNSLMSRIDTWVINQLLEQLVQKDNSHWQNYQFSINLSGASLNDQHFLDFLSRKLSECCLPPQLFCFEITEQIAINNIHKIRDFILALKNLGCSFALDDFGKGMSSLTYLKNLPVDYLKIDGSFITELDTDQVSQVMVEAINHLATGIGLKTVAEFVENQAILDALRHLKVDYAQGYHLGRPQKFAEVI